MKSSPFGYSLGSQGQVDPWGLLAGQSSSIVQLYVPREPSSQKKKIR